MDQSEPKVLNPDPSICFCCSQPASKSLELKSEDAWTISYYCRNHLDGLRKVFGDYIKEARHTDRS